MVLHDSTGSTWNVQCSTAKWSARQVARSSSTRPDRPSAMTASSTTTCDASTGIPDVIVHTCRSWRADHSGDVEDVLTHGVEVDVLRRCLEEHVDRVSHQQPCARKDQQRHHDRADSVGPEPARGDDDDAAATAAMQGSQGVAEHLEVGALDVQARCGAVAQQSTTPTRLAARPTTAKSKHRPGRRPVGGLLKAVPRPRPGPRVPPPISSTALASAAKISSR